MCASAAVQVHSPPTRRPVRATRRGSLSIPALLPCQRRCPRGYDPSSGLEITDHTQGWKRTVPGSSFRSSVKDPDKLFVFCTSQAFERDLAVKT